MARLNPRRVAIALALCTALVLIFYEEEPAVYGAVYGEPASASASASAAQAAAFLPAEKPPAARASAKEGTAGSFAAGAGKPAAAAASSAAAPAKATAAAAAAAPDATDEGAPWYNSVKASRLRARGSRTVAQLRERLGRRHSHPGTDPSRLAGTEEWLKKPVLTMLHTIEWFETPAKVAQLTSVPVSILRSWNPEVLDGVGDNDQMSGVQGKGQKSGGMVGQNLRLGPWADDASLKAVFGRAKALEDEVCQSDSAAPLTVFAITTGSRAPQPSPLERKFFRIHGDSILKPDGSKLPRWRPKKGQDQHSGLRQLQQNRDVAMVLSDLVQNKCYGHCSFLWMEDDFRWCPGAKQEVEWVHKWAKRNQDAWDIIRVGYGFSGLLMKCSEVPALLAEVQFHVDEPGVDWIASIFFSGSSLIYRHNLFEHMSANSTTMGWSYAELMARNSQLAGCYQYLSGTGLHAVDYFDIDQCSSRMFSPCSSKKKGKVVVPSVADGPVNDFKKSLITKVAAERKRRQRAFSRSDISAVVAPRGKSCAQACGPACVPQLFSEVNQCDVMQKAFPGCKCEVSYGFHRFMNAWQSLPLFHDPTGYAEARESDYPKEAKPRCILSRDDLSSRSTCKGVPNMRAQADSDEQGQRLCMCNKTALLEFKDLIAGVKAAWLARGGSEKGETTLVSQAGESCNARCARHNDPRPNGIQFECSLQRFEHINNCEAMKQHFPSCKRHGCSLISPLPSAPAVAADARQDESNCFLSDDLVDTTCAAASGSWVRLCPCRGVVKMAKDLGKGGAAAAPKGAHQVVAAGVAKDGTRYERDPEGSLDPQKMAAKCYSRVWTGVSMTECVEKNEACYGAASKGYTMQYCAQGWPKSHDENLSKASIRQRKRRNCRGFATLQDAKAECSKVAKCSGVVKTGFATLPYELRFGSKLKVHPSFEKFFSAWSRIACCTSYESVEQAKKRCNELASCSGITTMLTRVELRAGPALVSLEGASTISSVPCASKELSSLIAVTSKPGESCTVRCSRESLLVQAGSPTVPGVCNAKNFKRINDCDAVRKHFKPCQARATCTVSFDQSSPDLHAVGIGQECRLNQNVLAGKNGDCDYTKVDSIRLCPCSAPEVRAEGLDKKKMERRR